MKNIVLLFMFLATFPTFLEAGIRFQFPNIKGSKYRIKNYIKQKIYRNGNFVRALESMNKATLEVISASNHTGLYTGKYYYYEKNLNNNEAPRLQNIYQSRFYRKSDGEIISSPRYLMPSLRSIPTFPTNEIEPGTTWTGEGEEIHEGILDPKNVFQFKVQVHYAYLGNAKLKGKDYARINIDYHVMYFPENGPEIFSFTGFSHSDYYWDIATSAPAFYQEEYAFLITLRNGENAFYKGTSEGIVNAIEDLSTNQKKLLKQEISNQISSDKGFKVKETDDSLVVNLGQILFDINRATLKHSVLPTIKKLATILRTYPNLDIIVSGHTDSTGSDRYNQKLSENRAKSVADYLIANGIAPNRISYIGMGDSKPVASNATAAGRRLNRRVEIKIITKE